MSKKGKKEEVPVELVVVDPEVVELEGVVRRWVLSGEESLKLMEEVQQLLVTLNASLEESQRDADEIQVEANQLLAIKAEPPASASTATTSKKTRGRKEVQEVHAEVELSATESAIRSIEEKKRQKIIHALTALFNLQPPLQNAGNTGGIIAASGRSFTSRRSPESSHQPSQIALSDTRSQRATELDILVASNEPKRPRDIPAVLWDDMVLLRHRRVEAEYRLKHYYAEIQRQLKRHKILQTMHEMSIYSCKSAKDILAKKMAECLEQQRLNAIPEEKEKKGGRGGGGGGS